MLPLHPPDVSLRGAKRRGNLGKAVAISPVTFPRCSRVLRDCTPRALPRASRSGRHVGLWPPRNDNSGSFAILTIAFPNRQCLPEIAPQGHFLALRAQGATSACGLLAMTNRGGPSSFYRRPADYAGAAPGAACRSPTGRVRSARALGNSRVRMALAERRYRRNRCVPF